MKNKTKLQNPRGTFDILPPTSYIWRYIQNNLSTITELFGYSPISTPIIEDSKLFARGVGESTDIVEKETYTFEDRGGDLISLRPEGTAPICRSYLQNGMHNLPQPIRLYYNGPFFRYDRPQSGRYRQLHQFGAELIGDSSSVSDVEIIQLAWNILNSLGIKDIKSMSHPNGSYNTKTLKILKDLKIKIGFRQIMKDEKNKVNNTNLEISRIDHAEIVKKYKI